MIGVKIGGCRQYQCHLTNLRAENLYHIFGGVWSMTNSLRLQGYLVALLFT